MSTAKGRADIYCEHDVVSLNATFVIQYHLLPPAGVAQLVAQRSCKP